MNTDTQMNRYCVRSIHETHGEKIVAANFNSFVEAETFADDLNRNAHSGFSFIVHPESP